jgi:hypothetical protein
MRFGMTGAAGALSVFLALAMAPTVQAQPWANGRDHFAPQAPAVEQSGRREWTWQGGNALSYGGPGRLRYEPGGTPRIIVTGDPAIVDTIEVDGGDIRRRNTSGFFNFSPRDAKVDILVRGVTLDKFTLSGSATMDLGQLQRDTLDLQVNGSGTLNALGQAKRLNLQVNGSGSARLGQLNAGQASIAVNGSGNIAMGAISEGGNLRVTGSGRADLGDIGKPMDITITGSGDANLGRVDTIDARLTGSGSVRLASMPRSATYHITGSGRVRAVGPDGKVVELAGPEKRNEERIQQQRERVLQQAERQRERALEQAERERERALDRAERDREREEARRERERERAQRDRD